VFTIKINYKNNIYSYPKDITLLELSKQFKEEYKYDIIVATVNNKLTELNAKLEKDCVVEFFDLSHLLGNRVYERGLVYLYTKAVKDVLQCNVLVEHSIDKGLYTTLVSDIEVTDDVITKIEDRMNELVNLKIPFEKLNVSRMEAIDYFEANNQKDVADSLRYISNSYISLYRLDNCYDYFYGEMPVDTSYLKYFNLTKLESNGIVLRFPNLYLGCEIASYTHHDKLFHEFKKYSEWSSNLNLNNVSDLNKIISTGVINDLIYMSEVEQDGRLMEIAKNIRNNSELKLILIAGPSSSGKTTTSKKLCLYLRSMGLNPHQISIDDYFLDRDKTPLKEDGKPDFESLSAINIDLFNEHLKKLLNGGEVKLPKYNFITGKTELTKKKLKLGEKGILVIEGLHALNEELTKTIERNNKYKIYISPLTSISLDNHNRISTSDNRLLRRMVRDNKYRGYTAEVTLSKWQDVREGEERYVFPYQDLADTVFNTSLVYELGVLRLYAEPLLFSVGEDNEYYGEAIRLLNILRNILPITSDSIPLDSIIREFIGKSYFRD
jgi:uridine kinase